MKVFKISIPEKKTTFSWYIIALKKGEKGM